MASNAYDQDKDDGGSSESAGDMTNENLNEDLSSNDPTIQTTDGKNDENDDANENKNDEPSKMKFDYRMQISAKHATEKQKMEHLVFRAILSDAFEDFQNLIKSDKVDLKKMDSLRWTPLMTAVQKRRTKIVEILIDNNSNIYKRDIKKRTVLHVACEMGFQEIVKSLLLRNKSDLEKQDDKKEDNNNNNKKKIPNIINIKDSGGLTSLHYACSRGHRHLLGLLLFNYKLHNLKCNINIQNTNGQTALHLACEKGHIECVKHILSYKHIKCNVNLIDKKGHTPLFRSVSKHHYEIVNMLLKLDADVNIRSKKLMTCIMVASQTKDNKMITILLDNKKSIPILWYENTLNRNVLYYLAKYKCDEKIYTRVLNILKKKLKECLMIYYPDLPDGIARLLSDMTYGVEYGDTLKDDAATQMYSAIGIKDRKPGDKLPFQ